MLCYGSSISEGPALQTERSDSRGGDGPQRLNGKRALGHMSKQGAKRCSE